MESGGKEPDNNAGKDQGRSKHQDSRLYADPGILDSNENGLLDFKNMRFVA